MPFSIRNPQAETLARRLAQLEKSSLTDAVIIALQEAITHRVRRETPGETAKRILAKHGLAVAEGHRPAPPEAYHDLDHELIAGNENVP